MRSLPQCLGVSLWLLAVGLMSSASAPVAAQGGRSTRPQVTPPQGAARQVIFKYCTTCHGIDDYAYNALDRAGWDAHLTTKHRGLDVPLPVDGRTRVGSLSYAIARALPTAGPGTTNRALFAAITRSLSGVQEECPVL